MSLVLVPPVSVTVNTRSPPSVTLGVPLMFTTGSKLTPGASLSLSVRPSGSVTVRFTGGSVPPPLTWAAPVGVSTTWPPTIS